VTHHTIDDEARFLILASDGVWEFIDNEKAVRIVNTVYSAGGPAEQACRLLIANAAVQWKLNEGPSYRDDITAIVLYLTESPLFDPYLCSTADLA
jgi:serine/threonine protein phosphatase PrpC